VGPLRALDSITPGGLRGHYGDRGTCRRRGERGAEERGERRGRRRG